MGTPKKVTPDIAENSPHDYQAEEAIIGAIILDNEWLQKLNFLIPDDFLGKANKAIFTAMSELQQRGMAIDKITIENHVLESKSLDSDLIPPGHIQHIVGATTTMQNVEYYAKIVQRCAFKRKLLEVGSHISLLAYDEDDIEVLQKKALAEIEGFLARSEGKNKHLKITRITKITTTPPSYNVYLPETVIDHVTWEQLVNFRKFSDLIGQVLDFIPIPVKQKDWQAILNTHLDGMDIDEAPEEASREGQIKWAVIKHLNETTPAESIEDLQIGRIYSSNGSNYLHSTALLLVLQNKYKIHIEAHELFSMVRKWGGYPKQIRISGMPVRLWGFPRKFSEGLYSHTIIDTNNGTKNQEEIPNQMMEFTSKTEEPEDGIYDLPD